MRNELPVCRFEATISEESMKNLKFQTKCKEVAETMGIEVCFYDDPRKHEAFEDDGYLHIVDKEIRACFDVGAAQSKTGAEQNALTARVIGLLKWKNFTPTMVFVDEGDDPETCPHCGAEL